MRSATQSAGRLKKALAVSVKLLLPMVVMAAVAVTAVVIKGWPMLPFIQASGPKYDPNDWCAEHGVPESLCTLCHPELKDKLLWCHEHGLPEALCTLCHPELAERFVMCQEHDLPESHCTICNPPAEGSEEKTDWCAEHGVPESACTLCDPGLASALCAEYQVPEPLCTQCNTELAEQIPTCEAHGLPPAFCPECEDLSAALPGGAGGPLGVRARRGLRSQILLPKGPKSAELCRLELPMVKLASAQTRRDAGIEVVGVQTRRLTQKITCNGQAVYHQNRFAQVRPRVEGILSEIRVDTGSEVRQGDVLAVVDSVQLGEAKAAYLSAQASRELAEENAGRLKNLASQQIVPGKNLLEAETRLHEARIQLAQAMQRLRNFGMSTAQIEQLARTKDGYSLLPITAPIDGVVVRRDAVRGEAVEATTELFAVADVRTMWVYLDLYENDLRWIQVGLPVSFVVESLPGSGFSGKLTWISPEVNPRTRTIQARAEVENLDGLLRAGMYGTGVIEIEAPGEAPVVPKTAVQWHERSPVVFVEKGPDLFEPRRVSIGRKDGPFWEITAGVRPGELVVTTGSYLLKTELMKGSIGAGCCGD